MIICAWFLKNVSGLLFFWRSKIEKFSGVGDVRDVWLVEPQLSFGRREEGRHFESDVLVVKDVVHHFVDAVLTRRPPFEVFFGHFIEQIVNGLSNLDGRVEAKNFKKSHSEREDVALEASHSLELVRTCEEEGVWDGQVEGRVSEERGAKVNKVEEEFSLLLTPANIVRLDVPVDNIVAVQNGELVEQDKHHPHKVCLVEEGCMFKFGVGEVSEIASFHPLQNQVLLLRLES